MHTIPASHEDILHKRAFAHIATVDRTGAPQVTPVWVDYDGEHVLINSAKGRKKDRNLRANSQVAISILDPDDPYRYLGLQGEVVEITEDGAFDHIQQLAHKYWGRPFNPLGEGEIRVLYKIRPTRVWTKG